MLHRLSILLLLLLPLSCRSLTSKDEELLEAASRADLPGIQQLLHEGASSNAVRHGTETVLGLLISQYKRSHQNRRKEIEVLASTLLAKGANANALHHGFTPLQIATGQGSEILVSRLLAYGADPNQATQAGYAPLWQAVFDNNPTIVLTLLHEGADPNALGPRKQTPLQYLTHRGVQKTRIMLHLRQHGGR